MDIRSQMGRRALGPVSGLAWGRLSPVPRICLLKCWHGVAWPRGKGWAAGESGSGLNPPFIVMYGCESWIIKKAEC